MSQIIDSEGIILSIQPHGETSAIVDVFTETAGIIKGYAKGARTQKNSGTYQKGNLVSVTHSRRLTEQLGSLQADVIQCLWESLSTHRLKFKIFNVLCDLKKITLAAYVYEPDIYQAFLELIEFLQTTDDTNSLKRYYIDYLHFILQKTGYAPDFNRCGVTGVQDNVIYVSPKTARAICQEIGQPYHDKLFLLPEFLRYPQQPANDQDLENAQKIMQLCYNHFIFYPQDKGMVIAV